MKILDIILRGYRVPSYTLPFVLFTAVVLVYQHAWVPGLFSDGGIYSTIAGNMAEGRGWLVPHFTPQLFLKFFEHPPFYMMFTGGLFKLFGTSFTVARLPNLLVILLLLTTIWYQVRKIDGDRLAYVAAFILILCPTFIKKSRFLNMDIPLTLFITASLLFYLWAVSGERSGRNWLLSGVAFGLALLMKGPPAFLIVAVMGGHLLVSGQLKKLLSIYPWLGFLLGWVIFSIWPLMLYQAGEWEGFRYWFNHQFMGTVVGGRGQTELRPFAYLIGFIKSAAPWFLLACYSTFEIIRSRDRSRVGWLFVVWFWGGLLLLSMMRWKLTHYILPLYPPMAILAAFTLHRAGERVCKYFTLVTKDLIMLATLVLITLPLTTEIRRLPHVFKIRDIMEQLAVRPDSVAMVGSLDPTSEFKASVLFPQSGLNFFDLEESELVSFIENGKLRGDNRHWLFYLPYQMMERLERAYPKKFSRRLFKLINLPRRQAVVVVARELVGEQFILTF